MRKKNFESTTCESTKCESRICESKKNCH